MPLKNSDRTPSKGQQISIPAVPATKITVPDLHSSSRFHGERSTIRAQSLPIIQIRPEDIGSVSESRDYLKRQNHTASVFDPKYSLDIDPLLQQNIARRPRIVIQDPASINKAARTAYYENSEHRVDTANAEVRRVPTEVDYAPRDRTEYFLEDSMLRTVNKDDYLLGRGANPRTGVVTPGGTSIDHSIDLEGLSPIEIVPPPAKWKQKGDQWVSLDIDQPTPLATVPILPDLRSRFLQSPSAEKQTIESKRPRNQQESYDDKTNDTNRPDSRCLPGSYPESPMKNPDSDQQQSPPKPTAAPVKRKPVGTSSSKPSSGTRIPLEQRQGSAPIEISHQSGGGYRSFSVPDLHKQSHSPVQVAKNPQRAMEQHRLGESRAAEKVQGSRSFLGARSQTLTGLHQLYKSSQSSQEPNLDKELPCLPTSSGPYQQPLSNTLPAHIPSPQQKSSPNLIDIATPQPAQKLNQTDSRSRRSHIADMAIPVEQMSPRKRRDLMMDESAYEIPKYDNPPRHINPRSARQQVRGPRAMPRAIPQHFNVRPHASGVNEMFLDPFNTTSMNTDTFMYAPPNRRIRPQHRMRYPPLAQPPPRVPLPAIPVPKHNRRDAVVMDSMDVEIAIGKDLRPPILPERSTQRPQMPSRAPALLQIPRAPTLQDSMNTTHTGRLNLSNTTGTPTVENRGGNQSCLSQIVSSASEGDPKAVNGQRSFEVTKTERPEISNPDSMRRCSRCQHETTGGSSMNTNSSIAPKSSSRRSIDSAHAPEVVDSMSLSTTVVAEAKSRPSQDSSTSHTHSETSATILNVEDDLRDHSMCCPDCCKLDCHIGCLGHPSPLLSPTRCSAQIEDDNLRRLDSCSTLVSTSSETFASEDKEDRKHKLSFVKYAFKLVFGQKSMSNDCQDTSRDRVTKVDSRRDRDSTSSALASSPKRATIVSGHEGAMAAARRAIASNLSVCNTDGLNQLIIPKKRSRTKKPTSNVATKVETTAGEDLLSAIPVIKVSATANERRKITGSRPCSGTTILLHPSTEIRTISASSIDIRLPMLSGIDLGNLSEFLFIVPFEAIRMWLRNNPQVMSFGWSALDCGQMMCFAALATTKVLLATVYVYSKTGRLKIKDTRGQKIGVQQLIIDSMRSVLYVLVLFGVAVVFWRIIRFFLFPIRLLVLAGQYLILGKKTAGR